MTDQFRPLVRHFFGRFFDNEFVAENTDMQVTVTKLLALLASPGLLLPFFRWTTYLALDRAAGRGSDAGIVVRPVLPDLLRDSGDGRR